ncbi:ribonuclease P protein component-like protein [Leptospira bouyouniensis]|uniref:Ribonuclease P protein component-like protein n=1 Tax=Leptospira bouyouniensis TaxID=2484911 RepID=A0A7I0HU72_9LEPT|nr:ribonuclease P protein component-like protein [Leptospira bouyouniensis]
MQELFRQNRKMGKPPLRWLVRKNGLPFASFLFCPDKTHKTAVLRNRSKRILRELVRKNLSLIPVGYDCALLVQVGFAKLSKEDREVLFLSALKQIP